jgi:hypothetical protein
VNRRGFLNSRGGCNTLTSYYGASHTIAEDDEGTTAPAAGNDAYTEGPDGSDMAVAPTSGTASTRYLTTDGQGNVTTVFGATNAAAPTCTIRFDPFGSPEIKATPDQRPLAVHMQFRSTVDEVFYKDGQRDSATGTYQYRARVRSRDIVGQDN